MSQHKVLFVDDEPGVLSSIRRAVAEEDYQAFFAGSGTEALSLMEKNQFSVIVTDMRMPAMDGLALLKLVKEKYPKTIRVVLSGYTQLSQVLVTINQGEIFKFITKPWTSENELLPAIQQSIDYYNLQRERDTLSETLSAKNAAYQNMFRFMETKKAQEKAEFRHLYKISSLIFSLWKKQIAITTEAAVSENEIIHLVEVIYLSYLSQLPAVIDTRSSDRFIHEIVAACDNRLTVNNLAPKDFSVKGNHAYILLVFKVLFHTLPKIAKITACKLMQTKNDDSLRMSFIIDLSPYTFNEHDKNLVQIVCSLLDKISKFYNINIALSSEESNLHDIQIHWDINM